MPSAPETLPAAPDPAESPRDRLAQLRARIARIERLGQAGHTVRTIGVPEIDRALPWGGLPAGTVHEIHGSTERDAAAAGFAALLAGRIAERRAVVWLTQGDPPYGPGLAAFGIEAGQVMLVRARRPADRLWALEEALRCTAVGAVLGEQVQPDFAQSRRLQLAASESGTTALLLPPATGTLPASAAVTRWRVQAASCVSERSGTLGAPRWRLELMRCRGGKPCDWLVDWSHETNHLAVAADAGDRPGRASARPSRAA